MPKFKTNPKTAMLGSVVLAILRSLNYEDYRHIVDPVFADHGIDEIDPETFYPAQLLLDMYRAMEEKAGSMFDFVAIGKKVAEDFEFADNVTTIAQAINGLNAAYEVMLRDFDKSEFYTIEQVSEQHLRIRDNNPYPHDMVYGYIYTLAHRFKPEGTSPTVIRVFDNPDNPNEGGAIYNITW